MHKTSQKLPGIVWRIISFIPAFNWIPLLYIGIKYRNIVNIISSITYCLVTFTFPTISPLLWIIGIIHYAITIQLLKKKINTTGRTAANKFRHVKRRMLPQEIKDSHGFSDLNIAGNPEKGIAIPPRTTPPVDYVQLTTFINTSQNKFFKDMRKYASLEGKPAVFVPFMAYWPTYDSMNKQQRLWYFYWRTQLRQGNFLHTDLSYVFLLVYEILSGVGWQKPQEGYELLMQLCSAYKSNYPTLTKYLSNWIFDFALQFNLPYNFLDEYDLVKLSPSAMTDALIDQHTNDIPLRLPFALIDVLCDYPVVKSKFFKEGNQDLMQEAIPRVIALADAALRKKTQKGIIATYGPSKSIKQDYFPFRNAVCPSANKKSVITVKPYSSNKRLRAQINELVRYGENTLRELRGWNGRLRGITLDAEMAKHISLFLTKEYGQIETKKDVSVNRSEVVLDIKSIEILREKSDAVRAALHVEDDTVSPEKESLTNLQEIRAICIALSTEARQFLNQLEQYNWERELLFEYEEIITEINRLAEPYLGCSLLIKEEGSIMVEDDYRDELDYIYQNPPQIPDASLTMFNLSTLPPELKEFFVMLAPEHLKALYALLASKHPLSDIEKIAEESMTMPQIIIDEINEIAMVALGDLIIDSMEQKPVIIDEYLTTFKQSINGIGEDGNVISKN